MPWTWRERQGPPYLPLVDTVNPLLPEVTVPFRPEAF